MPNRPFLHSVKSMAAWLFGVVWLLVLSGCGGGTSTSAKGTLQSITVSPSGTTVAIGQTLQYTAEAHYRDGSSRQQLAAEWATSDATLATVNFAGLLTAVKPGKVTVTATIAMPSGSLTGSSVVTIVSATSATASRGTMQDAPLFTTLPIPLICAESSFVAIASLSHPEQLIIIRIGPVGVEEPHTIPLESDVYGMKCNYQRVELLVEGQNEDFFSRLPFTIRDDAIDRKKPIPIEYSISGKGPTPVEIEDFHKTRAAQRGDWYVQIPGYQGLNTTYELHFVSTVERSTDALKSELVIDLLEETWDRAVTKTVRLVRIENSEGGE